MNDLSCGVTRDLLPLYVDGVAGDETMAAVSSHLEWCDDCKKLYDKMRRELVIPPAREDTALLERLRRKARRQRLSWIAAGVALGLLLLLGILLGVRAHRESVRGGAFLRIPQNVVSATAAVSRQGYAQAALTAMTERSGGRQAYSQTGVRRTLEKNLVLADMGDSTANTEGRGCILLHFSQPLMGLRAETASGRALPITVLDGKGYLVRLDLCGVCGELEEQGAVWLQNFGAVEGRTCAATPYYAVTGNLYWLEETTRIRVTGSGEKYDYVYEFDVQFICTLS